MSMNTNDGSGQKRNIAQVSATNLALLRGAMGNYDESDVDQSFVNDSSFSMPDQRVYRNLPEGENENPNIQRCAVVDEDYGTDSSDEVCSLTVTILLSLHMV